MEEIKEVVAYFKATKDLDEVSKGGKYYASCSFIDVSIRMDRKEEARKNAIIALGTIALSSIAVT